MINSEIIEKAVYDLCVEANTTLNDGVFSSILSAYKSETNTDAKEALGLILENAKLSCELKKPLCQDTGQVLIFVKIGEKCIVENLNKSITNGVQKAYEENFYRKSVVKNAIFDRTNTNTNTPCIIYTELIKGEELEIELLIKGAGSENKSQIAMLSPTASEEEIIEFVKKVAKEAGASACPPFFIGVGVGGTMDYAALLSKKALLLEKDIDENHKNLAEKIKIAVNDLNIGAAARGGASTALDVKILTDFTHIASMPVAVTINCHSSRHAKGKINKYNELIVPPLRGNRNCYCNYEGGTEKSSNSLPPTQTTSPKRYSTVCSAESIKEGGQNQLYPLSINTSDINALKSLKVGQNILLSGEIYTARDMAHKKLIEMIEKGETLPFNLKNKIIFYAGPCPCSESEIIGSVGPTTASRMDKFAPRLYESGILATIGKGGRSKEIQETLKKTGGLYFTTIGGIACYLSQKIIKKELIAFEELGTEAIYRLEIKDFPVKLELA